MVPFSKRLKEAMDIRGLKQIDIAEKTGIGRGTLSSYLSGRYEPKKSKLLLLSQALNVDVVWLMGYDVEMEPDHEAERVANLLSKAEKDKRSLNLLENFFTMPKDRQDILLDMAKGLSSKQ